MKRSTKAIVFFIIALLSGGLAYLIGILFFDGFAWWTWFLVAGGIAAAAESAVYFWVLVDKEIEDNEHRRR